MVRHEPMAPYFAGERLWGDDFTQEEISEWFDQEREAYADLVGAATGQSHEAAATTAYSYHALNVIHGFRHLPPEKRFTACLAVGAAYGEELRPVVDRIDRIDIVEPSVRFHNKSALEGVPIAYHFPVPNGDMPFAERKFDLITCLGCLHHIPNVSHVVSELYRVCSYGGFVLVRDPISSMGDWRTPRRGGTKNERGIPLTIFDSVVRGAGFSVHRRTLCMFPPLSRLWRGIARGTCYNSQIATRLDGILSSLMSWNMTYHRTKLWQKLAPGAVYYVLCRDVH